MKRPTGWKPNPQAMAAVSRQPFVNPLGLSVFADVDTWLTPPQILSQLGDFDLDPCAAECAPFHAGAALSYTVAEDGLVQPWRGRVFMNPPFSNTVPWLRKHSEHREGISLVPASVESIVWRECVWKRAGAILLLHGRTRFCNPDGSTTTGRPLRSIALIAWSERDAVILASSALAGVFVRDWDQR